MSAGRQRRGDDVSRDADGDRAQRILAAILAHEHQLRASAGHRGRWSLERHVGGKAIGARFGERQQPGLARFNLRVSAGGGPLLAEVRRAVGDDDAAWLQRCDQALFGGLWNLPMMEGEGRDDAQEALRKAGLRGKLSSRKIGDVVHILSHRRMHVEVWTAVVTKERGTMTRSST